MKGVIYLGILVLSSNNLAQSFSEPRPFSVLGLPPDWGAHWIIDIIHPSSDTLWCYFALSYPSKEKRGSCYIAHYDYHREEWIDPIEVTESIPQGRLVEDKKGRLWIIGRRDAQLYGCYYDGYSFSEPVRIPAPHWQVGHIVCRDSMGNIWVVWLTEYYSTGGWELGYNWYDGEVWYPAVRLTTHHTRYCYVPYSLITDKDGRVWVAWSSEAGPIENLIEGSYLKYYNGEQWSDSVCIPDTDALYPKLACDSRGRIWTTWLSWPTAKFGDTATIYVAYYDKGEWSTSTLVSKEVPASYPVYFIPSPVIAIDRGDRIWVVWNSNKSDSYGNIWFVYFNGKEWSEPANIYQKPHTQYWEPYLIVDKEGKVWCWWSAIDTSITRRICYICHTTEAGIKGSKDDTIKLELLGISPNPFKTVTSIKWQVAGEEPVNLEIYDATGRLVRTFAKTQNLKPGAYTMSWDGKKENGELLPAGVYFVKLKAGSSVLTKKVTLLR